MKLGANKLCVDDRYSISTKNVDGYSHTSNAPFNFSKSQWFGYVCRLICLILITTMAWLLNPPVSANAIDGVCVAFCDDYVPPVIDDNTNNNSGSGSLYAAPKGIGWFCEARARDGSWGWGESSNKNSASNIALSQCGQHAGNCRITVCSEGAGKSYDHVNGRWRSKPAIKKQTNAGAKRTTKTAVKLSCDVCYSKLKADVNTGWASGRLRSHVQSSVSGYNNCKQKSDLQCVAGNRLSFALSTQCLLTFTDNDYQVCIADVLKRNLF